VISWFRGIQLTGKDRGPAQRFRALGPAARERVTLDADGDRPERSWLTLVLALERGPGTAAIRATITDRSMPSTASSAISMPARYPPCGRLAYLPRCPWSGDGCEQAGETGEMQEANVLSSRFASMLPAAPMATIRVRGARWPHTS